MTMKPCSAVLIAVLAAPFLIGAGTAAGELRVDVGNLRSAKGVVFLCLSANPKHFPDCSGDPAAKTMKVPASQGARVVFPQVAAGRYALSAMHDENGNSKLDTMMGMPREGFGFSRNPVVRMGPPKFSEVSFAMTTESMSLPVRMKYFL